MAAAKTDSPTYIRLAREKTPIMTTEDTPFEIGKAREMFRSRIKIAPAKGKPHAVGIIATGALLYKALKVAKKLEDEGKEIIVMNLATIKPLDEHAIIKLAHETGGIVTVEEHQIAGGMGSAVAECLAAHFPVPIEFVGVKDQFGQSGKPDELLEHYGMGEKDIYAAVQRVMLRK
jgi:transketolase